ncbi:hypothetical protein [Aeribacillus alveayuensis]|jgi:hypothetical protein|uniref:Uncharacterized protein n=1 Tax=Aeribacillus alveayuensis TaxID=279215 RepID=A0ABT9VS99_9BACI|nr:hypothetical protein [Bacillus alveayuensis]
MKKAVIIFYTIASFPILSFLYSFIFHQAVKVKDIFYATTLLSSAFWLQRGLKKENYSK